MAIQPVELSIAEIEELYQIKTSTAYKWRKFLRDNDLAVNQENCDRINNRELIMTEPVAAIVQVEEESQSVLPTENANQMTPFGITVGRFQELNTEVKYEVAIKAKLREFHESELQSKHSQELSQRVQEVQNLDPKNLGDMLKNMGIA